MKKQLLTLVSLMMVAAMVITSCSSPAATTAPPATSAPVTAPTTAPVTAPTAVPSVTVAATLAAEATTIPTVAATIALPTGAPTLVAPPISGTVTAEPINQTIDCKGAKSGDTVVMYYQWSGQEEQKLNQILKPLVDTCGLNLQVTSTRDQAVLDTQIKAGNPPDVAFWNIAQLVQYQDKLIALDTLGADKNQYEAFFTDPGTISGKWVGLPVKTDIKTIIWYSPTVFQAKGYTVPTTWDELNTLVDKMSSNGDIPWSMGFESGSSTGWTGADWIEDIMLVQQGPDFVKNLITGKTPYNSPEVATAWQTYGKWATDPKYTIGGAQGTLSTNFNTAIDDVFSDPPKAMMVRQSGFASGEINSKYPDLKYPTDYDFFMVPGAQGLQGGADWLMAFKNTPAVQALVTYLSSPLGGANWAKANFDLSPNKGANGQYTEPIEIKKGQVLANAKGYVLSIGDVIPDGFNPTLWTGIVNYVNGQDLQTQLNNIEQSQKANTAGQ